MCGELAAADGDASAPVATAAGNWYCVGFDASHSYTSPDVLPTPLKFHWAWQPPESEKAEVLQAVSSDGKLFIHCRHSNATPVGQRLGCHNWVVDLDTGASQGEDPSGTTPNDETVGHPIGTCGGVVYQCDDGGPPVGGGDVWSPIQVSPAQGWWAVIQQRKIDGPDPGIYCMQIGQGVGSGWHASITAPGNPNTAVFCTGAVAIGSGVLYTTTTWSLTGNDLVNGLACYELTTGKRIWKLDGQFVGVSPGKDWCVAVDQRNVLVVVSATDGKVMATTDIAAQPACPLMVVDTTIGLYDVRGGFIRYGLISKNGKYALKSLGRLDIGNFEGPSLAGPYNSPFCFSSDGTMYIANGASVAGIASSKKGKSWSWNAPPEVLHAIGPLGHPIIARGKLVVVGHGGVVCFDKAGLPPTGGSKTKP